SMARRPPTPATSESSLQRALTKALQGITGMDERLSAFEAHHAEVLSAVEASDRLSARNLLHYLALRSSDIRDLQDQLSRLGLSSLGRSEAHVQATVRAVRSVLRTLLGRENGSALQGGENGSATRLTGPSFAAGAKLLLEHNNTLLKAAPRDRRAR